MSLAFIPVLETSPEPRPQWVINYKRYAEMCGLSDIPPNKWNVLLVYTQTNFKLEPMGTTKTLHTALANCCSANQGSKLHKDTVTWGRKRSWISIIYTLFFSKGKATANRFTRMCFWTRVNNLPADNNRLADRRRIPCALTTEVHAINYHSWTY